jgi:hypothetical protein
MSVVFNAFSWIESTGMAKAINESLYAFAYIETAHLVALAVLGGATLLVDFRMLGLGLKEQSVTELARIARPWLNWSLFTVLLTGFFLFASLAATKYYVHTYFWVKMYFLAAAIVFTYTLRQWVINGGDARADSGAGKVAGMLSAFLWAGVAFAGKAIGYIS